MYTTRKVPAEFDVADQVSKRLVGELLQHMTPIKQGITLPATESWYANPARRGSLFFLKEGMLAYRREDRLLFSFNDGDLVGVENVFCSSDSTLAAEFAVIVDEYSADAFFSTINGNQAMLKVWNEYLAQQFKLFSIMLASLVNEQEGFVPDVRFFMDGQTIVEQGVVSNEIFTMVEGMAEVSVDGNKVADVLPDEVFGAIGALSGSPQMATITALSDCMVVVLSKDDFRHMLFTRPGTVVQLMENMARVLLTMNDKLSVLNEIKG